MTERFGVNVAFRSDVGQTRRHNEDFAGYYEPDDLDTLARFGRLYVVADGVGGAAAGEVASRYAVRKILAEFYTGDSADPETHLTQAVQTASGDIYTFAARHPHPMATTLVAALVRERELTIVNVGDSRAYLVRGEEMRQVTEDHSLVAQMVRQGHISAEEATTHPKRNLLTRTVGGSATVQVDVFAGPLALGDIVVLCTDGLTRYVGPDEIAEKVRIQRPQQAVDELVALANERGGKDNITVLVLHIVEPEDDLDTQRHEALEPIEPNAMPDLEEELARMIVAHNPLSRTPWWKWRKPLHQSPLGIIAVAAILIGIALLVLGGISGSDAPSPTAVPQAGFAPGAAVRFEMGGAVRKAPDAQAEQVASVAAGREGQILGGPVEDGTGTIWWLVQFDESVTGWVQQLLLEAVPGK